MKKVLYKVNGNYDLIYHYLMFTKTVHKMSPSEIKVLAHFISAYLSLKPKVLDEDLLNKLVFSEDTRKGIMEAMDISKHSLSNTEISLRKKGVIKDGVINKAIIPELDGKHLKLFIYLQNNGRDNGASQSKASS